MRKTYIFLSVAAIVASPFHIFLTKKMALYIG